MLHRLILALALAAGVSLVGPSAAEAQVFVVQSCGATGVNLPLGPGGRFVQQIDGTLCTVAGSGSGGSTGSVTAPGTNGTQAQAVQGINGGVPQNSYTGQYNSTLPTFTNGQSGYVALDVNGRQILSPTVTLPVVAQDAVAPTGSPFSASATGVIFSIDTTGYQSVTVQLFNSFSALIVYEISNNNTDWVSVNGQNSNNAGGSTIGSADNSPIVRSFPNLARYFRARISTYSSGTVSAAVLLRSQPFTPPAQSTYVGGGNIAINAGASSIGSLGVTSTANGLTGFSRIPSSAATTNLTAAKTSAGRAYIYQGCNTTASTIYMRLYNAASTGAVTVGTTTPFAGPYAFQPNTCIQATPFAADIGVYASAGLVYAFGTAPADNDTTTIGAGAIAAFQIGYQ